MLQILLSASQFLNSKTIPCRITSYFQIQIITGNLLNIFLMTLLELVFDSFLPRAFNAALSFPFRFDLAIDRICKYDERIKAVHFFLKKPCTSRKPEPLLAPLIAC